MDMLGRTHLGFWLLLLAGGGRLLAQTLPARTPAPAPAGSATMPAPAVRRPTVDELLAQRKPAPFDFTNTPITDVIAYMAKNYDLEIVNKYELTDRITMKEAGNISAREAINDINASILAMGYTVLESVRGDPPRVVLTVIPTKVDAGTLVTVHYGNDPAQIPEGETRRTQVLTFVAVNPETARDMIRSVLSAEPDITVNTSTKTIVITDTATHIHAAASLLQVLEKQAAEKK